MDFIVKDGTEVVFDGRSYKAGEAISFDEAKPDHMHELNRLGMALRRRPAQASYLHRMMVAETTTSEAEE